MARPTREAEALREVAGLAEDLADEADNVVVWAEFEMSTAGQRFDKPAQARIARLAISAARIMRISGQIASITR